ncbi:MAG TPA: sulfite exporter TauE/SafE family protein [Thermoplasmata archaeon]|nr:sulfite exporter TauE/SafE family protein [Thermoplasmata archaeon]
MWDLSPASIDLAILAFCAAVVNGAVGYGFSSIVTPIALFWTTNRILNPALVLVELLVNVTLLIRERRLIRSTYPRTLPMIYGLLPGVVVGSVGLVLISATFVRIVVYALILPLTILQLLGYRRHIVRERTAGPVLGAGIGFLYSLTTISGPPLALFWRNQGLSKEEFRCAISQVRVAEASFTTVSYLLLGLFAPPSLGLIPVLLVPVIVGVPLGTIVLRGVSRDFFSRFIMAVDGIIVSYGLYTVLVKVHWLTNEEGLLFVLGITAMILVLLVRVVSRLPAILARTEARIREGRLEATLPGGAPLAGERALGADPPR